MGIIGVFLLGLGITLLIPCVVFLVTPPRVNNAVPSIFIGLLSMPMIVIGIVIIRRAEDGKVRRVVEPGPTPASNGVGNPMARIGAFVGRFDLNRLNWVGWLLLLATICFVAVEAAVLPHIRANPGWGGQVIGQFAFGSVLLAAGFFAGLRWLLRVLGVSIYRW